MFATIHFTTCHMAKQPNTEKWLEEIKSGSRVVFVYIIDGKFIGEGAIVFENGDPDYTISKQRVYLSRLIVKKEYRNQGIGSIIINYLVDYVKAMGYKEFSVLRLLMANPNTVVQKESIILKVWGCDSDAEDNNVEAYISFLRKKFFFLGSKVNIGTVRKVGYRLEVLE